jgi:hypothetical protein
LPVKTAQTEKVSAWKQLQAADVTPLGAPSLLTITSWERLGQYRGVLELALHRMVIDRIDLLPSRECDGGTIDGKQLPPPPT